MTGVRYDVEFKQEDVDKFLALTKSVFQEAMKNLALEVWGGIGREAPTDQGRLAGSFALEPTDDYSWRIYTNVEYALYVHDGTGIYGPNATRIVPVTANCLVFEWKGKTWFLKSVAGQKANPYADRAIEAAQARIDEFIEMALAKGGDE